MYIKTSDHNSNSVEHMTKVIKQVSLQEKMTLTGSGESTDNSIVQRKLFQLLNILEPLILNDENVIVAINAGLIEILGEMLIF